MAASFGSSSHCMRWILSKRQISESNAFDVMCLSRDEVYRLRLYFTEIMHFLGKAVKLRQRVISSAVVFFKRFYLNRCFGEFDPRIIAPTMLFVAAKVEETYLNAKVFVHMIKESADLLALYNNKQAGSVELTMETMLEYEFHALEGLGFDLIVFHPYRPITIMLAEIKQKEVLQMAWSITNDSYRTDLCLEYSPAKIGIAVIYLSLVLNDYSQEDRDEFLRMAGVCGNENTEVEDVLDISSRLIELYRYYSEVGKGGDLAPKDVIRNLVKLQDAFRCSTPATPATPRTPGMPEQHQQQRNSSSKGGGGLREVSSSPPTQKTRQLGGVSSSSSSNFQDRSRNNQLTLKMEVVR